MAAFRFRLQTLLKLRWADRERRQVQLAEAHRAEQLLRDQAEQLGAELSDVLERSRQLAAPGLVDVDDVLRTNRYELQLRAHQAVLRQQMTQLATEVQRRQQALLEADRQVRVLEKLRDRQRDEYHAELRRAEFKELDEVAQRRGRHQEGEPP